MPKNKRELDFNFYWKFKFLNGTKIPLKDSKLRGIRFPHDWSVEFYFNKEIDGCTGYLPGGTGELSDYWGSYFSGSNYSFKIRGTKN